MITASSIVGAALKLVILLVVPNKSEVTARFHWDCQEKEAEEILSGESEHPGNSMF